ncbi:MAG TPA: TetR/AcrR family transcriptional regulator [Blastocatellia bacterium]|nr:TetR/AcrR family transcriptional regulator [Blastocatellia bacterium]
MKNIKAVRPAGRQRRHLRTPNPEVRQRLLEAADNLIHELGFPSLRIEQIVERAGLSIGTFYLYFESKNDLFVNLVIENTVLLQRRLEAASRTEGSVLQRLDRVSDTYLDFVKEHERGFLYYHNSGHIDTTVGPLSVWAFNQSATTIRPLLEEGMASGEIKQTDPELLAQAVVGVTEHMAHYWLQHQEVCTREQIKVFLFHLLS